MKTISHCLFVNNKVKNIIYSDKNPNCNTTKHFLNKKFKKVMDEGIRTVLVMVKKEVDETFQSL